MPVPRFWDRLFGRRRAAALKHEDEEQQMSKTERRFFDESVEDHQVDEFVDEHLGGINPNRLLGDDAPPRD